MSAFEVFIALFLFQTLNLTLFYFAVRSMYFLFKPPVVSKAEKTEKKTRDEQFEELMEYNPFRRGNDE